MLEHYREYITYNMLNAVYDTSIFTEPTMKGQLGVNAMKAQKHLYDYIIYDSTNERDFATEMDTRAEVAVYVKLPNGFYINTPVGRYNPDWAIAFQEGAVKHIYFVAETKGSNINTNPTFFNAQNASQLFLMSLGSESFSG